ncbi:Alpha/Beta hydrolase protein [Dendryphion nanum]|uniref:Alpha/Beta hydrolase protein n=1 Tax=Dendryphion nanum TaxID=256645 RepID=A0A9P9DJ63_9PLEO|nr:Alpha/Beta hydrolase protein [Dendryphion nanum]
MHSLSPPPPPSIFGCSSLPALSRRRSISHLACILSFVAVPRQPRYSRPFSAVHAIPKAERVNVQCRSNGSFDLDILHPKTQSASVLIYLPSGPLLPDVSQAEDHLISALAASTHTSTIVRVNYRCSPHHRFPTPIHDVTLAYDWILHNLLPDTTRHAKIAVCGELVGASLATMLALTECRIGQSRIVAAAVNNPIADWVFPDDLPAQDFSQLPEPNAPEEIAVPAGEDIMATWSTTVTNENDLHTTTATSAKKPQKRKRATKPPPPVAWLDNADNPILPSLTLSGERDVIFQRPDDCFDRFASPIHFFRSPYGQLIYPRQDDLFASSSPSDIPLDSLDIETRMNINHFDSLESTPPPPPDVPTLTRCRAYARIYPPAGSNLVLPKFHITTGSQSPLLDQAAELAKGIKRSIARQTLRARTARVHWQDPAEKEKFEAYAEERVQLNTLNGVGLWSLPDGKSDTNAQIHHLGAWMRQCLGLS